MQVNGIFEFIAINWNDEWWITLIKLIVWGAVLGGLLFKSTDRVETGQQALRKRFGKVVRHHRGPNKGKAVVVDAGFILLIPFVDSLWKQSIQLQQQELRGQLREKVTHLFERIEVKIFYRITDIELALVGNEDANQLIVTMCENNLRQLTEAGANSSEIEAQLVEMTAGQLRAQYGADELQAFVVFDGFTDSSQLAAGLAKTSPSPATVAALLTRNGNGNGHHPAEAAPVS